MNVVEQTILDDPTNCHFCGASSNLRFYVIRASSGACICNECIDNAAELGRDIGAI